LGHRAGLGRYDFIVVVEAPDDKAMMQVSAKIGALGGADVETLPAVPSDEFVADLYPGGLRAETIG
jgi:uncharacterized protein with GYD domain